MPKIDKLIIGGLVIENYCRGVLFGMLAGVCVGAIVVAKNKKLSKKINEGFDLAVEKVEDIKESLEEKNDQKDAVFCDSNGKCYGVGTSELGKEKDENNFDKKVKNK